MTMPEIEKRELDRLVHALCEDALDSAGASRLHDLLAGYDEAQVFYIEAMDLHAGLAWNHRMRRPARTGMGRAGDGAIHRPISPSPHFRIAPSFRVLGGLLHVDAESPAIAALMWLVLALLGAGVVMTVIFCITLAFRGAGSNVRVDAPQVAETRTGTGRVGNGEMGEAILLPISPSPHRSESTVARLINAAECRWAVGSHSPHVGDDLEPGRKLELLSGLAEIMFESGVRCVLQGPATMEVASRTGAVLRRGKLTIKVEDPDARGFEVRAPGMKYTDLGTEFGVWVRKDGAQEVVVFRGSVKAEAVDRRDGEIGRWGDGETDAASFSPSSHHALSPSSIVLTAHQAVRLGAPGKPMERIKAEEKQFVRAIPQAEPFALFSTGAGLDRGAADPHWELVKSSANAPDTPGMAGKPQAAVVAEPPSVYLSDSRDKAQWISNSGVLKDLPAGCRWTFRTRFDLAGFDASTARIEGRISADDYVTEIRLNGIAMPLPDGAHSEALSQKRWLALKIERGFAGGQNTLEIVIENAPAPRINSMALCVDCKGTAWRPQAPGATETSEKTGKTDE
jgi:hypothetical protein